MRRLAAAVALLALAACEGGGDPVQMALRDAAAARHAAALEATAESPPMVSAPSSDAAYVAEMIAHHRAGIALAADALTRSDDPEIRRMAQAEIEARMRGVAELQAWKPAAQAPVR